MIVNEGESVRVLVELTDAPTSASWYVYDAETDANIASGTVAVAGQTSITLEIPPSTTAITDDKKQFNNRQLVFEAVFENDPNKKAIEVLPFKVRNLWGS